VKKVSGTSKNACALVCAPACEPTFQARSERSLP